MEGSVQHSGHRRKSLTQVEYIKGGASLPSGRGRGGMHTEGWAPLHMQECAHGYSAVQNSWGT